jgi:hypothetical protein
MIDSPIETEFDGYRFRTRLEARWAVFFKELRIPYAYEHEGYALAGEWYLPDFWLPRAKCYVEVKPSADDREASDVRLYDLIGISEPHEARMARLLGAQHPVFLVYGDPVNVTDSVFDHFSYGVGRRLGVDTVPDYFTQTLRCLGETFDAAAVAEAAAAARAARF